MTTPSTDSGLIDGLERIKNRIPPGWGRWISCGPGWYSLLVKLDEDLSTLAPDYEVHQVKEKYGTLRFYIGLPSIEPDCCRAFDTDNPRPYDEPVSGPWVPKDRPAEKQAVLDSWLQKRLAHTASDLHKQACLDLESDPRVLERIKVVPEMNRLVREAESRSASTCEECSLPAALAVSGGWYKTLCPECLVSLDYEFVENLL